MFFVILAKHYKIKRGLSHLIEHEQSKFATLPNKEEYQTLLTAKIPNKSLQRLYYLKEIIDTKDNLSLQYVEIFKNIIDAESEFTFVKEKINKDINKLISSEQELANELKSRQIALREINQKILQAKIDLKPLEELSDLEELGIHAPVFELDNHASYVAALTRNKLKQKDMVSAKKQ